MEPLGLMRLVPDLPAALAGLPVQVLFTKSSSKHYTAAITLAQKAAQYTEHEIDGVKYHVAAFSSEPKQFMLAGVLIDYVAGWKATVVVCGGRRLHNHFKFSELVSCMGTASQCADPKAHCCEVIKRAFAEDPYPQISQTMLVFRFPGEIPVQEETPVPEAAYISPCRLLRLSGRLSRHHPSTPEAQIESMSKAGFIDVCPYFNAALFREIKNTNDRDAESPI